MNFIGNLLWLIFGGLIVALLYFLCGALLCITIVGIPVGVQLTKIGALALHPFGRTVTTSDNQGCFSIGFTVIWIVGGWWEIALIHLVFSIILTITIIGIPFAKAHWRLMKMSFMPMSLRAE